MEVALGFVNLGIIVFNFGYMYNMLKEYVNLLSKKFEIRSIVEWKVRFSFALVVLDGLRCVLDGDGWIIWILWIVLFLNNLNNLKNVKK